jgi:hypothetical protein
MAEVRTGRPTKETGKTGEHAQEHGHPGQCPSPDRSPGRPSARRRRCNSPILVPQPRALWLPSSAKN